MFDKLREYKKPMVYGLIVIAVGLILFLGYKCIDNGPYLWNSLSLVIERFLDIISPIIFAFILAYLLYIPVRFIEKQLLKLFGKKEPTKRSRGWIRVLSIMLVFILVIALFSTLVNFLIPPFVNNIKNFINSIPEFEVKIGLWIKELTEYLDTLNIDYTSNGQLMIQAKDFMLNVGHGLLGGFTSFVGRFGSLVVDTVVTVILTFYFLKDKEKLFAAISKFGTLICSPRVKSGIIHFFKDLDDIVGKFLVGTIFSSIIVGIVSTVLMLIIRHPFAILIGVAAGVTNVIPYVGPIIGSGLAFVLGAFTSVKLGILGAVLLLLYQQVDGNVIQPKIVGDKVGVAPVWILMAVLIGGSYFGGIGMIISIPIAGLVAVYIDRLYKKRVK